MQRTAQRESSNSSAYAEPLLQKAIKIAYGDGLFALLHHVLTVCAANAQTYLNCYRKPHDYVSRVKIQPEVKQAYMHYEDIIYYERKEAAEIAAKEAAEAAAKAARVQDILDLLEEHGEVPEAVKQRLNEEEDAETLKLWHKLAARADSVEAFCALMDEQ